MMHVVYLYLYAVSMVIAFVRLVWIRNRIWISRISRSIILLALARARRGGAIREFDKYSLWRLKDVSSNMHTRVLGLACDSLVIGKFLVVILNYYRLSSAL